jgi:uncharacterized protein YkwD
MRKSQLNLQSLDVRDVPANLPTFEVFMTNGIVNVVGTPNDDTINIEQSGANIVVDGRSFPATRVRSIVVLAGDGNDRVEVARSLVKATHIYGEAGDDTIIGGGGSDRVFGGWGNDTIDGREGNDRIFGGAGDDILDGGRGRNQVVDDFGYEARTINTANDLKVLEQINELRRENGLHALQIDAQLNMAAYMQAEGMMRSGITPRDPFAFPTTPLYGTDNPTLANRIEVVGMKYNEANHFFAENLAAGVLNAKEVVSGWSFNKTTNDNMLNVDYNAVGIAIWTNPRGRSFYSVVFGNV